MFTRFFSLVFACALLSGCIVETDVFLSDPRSSSVDERLLGSWLPKTRDGGAPGGHVIVTRDRSYPNNVLTLTLKDKDPGREPGLMEAWTTTLGNRTFLNLKANQDDGQILVAYRFAGPDRLEVAQMDPDAFAALVEDRKLKGTVSRSYGTSSVALTETREKLISVITDPANTSLMPFDNAKLAVVLTRMKTN